MSYSFKYFVSLVLFLFSYSVFSVEISSDLFISEQESLEQDDSSVEEWENTVDWEEPVVKRVYTKEKVIIKRDTSALDEEVENLKQRKTYSLDTKRRPSSSSKMPLESVDYGDYEIRWTKRNK